MSNNPTARERQLHVAHLVARYQREPSAIEHERLLLLIKQEYGPLAADFFQQEGCLPLASRTGPGNYPYPMHQGESSLFAMGVLICSIITANVVGWSVAGIINIMPATLLGLASGFAVWFAVSPVIGRFFPPKDLPERQRLVEAFEVGKRLRSAGR